ncbi:hypothetical protein SHL15_8287 [Streptomyces hygroscopicus subsp. limoneus]|nr:hypothetical protein SHL15_8287 [Streptomyces hygroscopicus subsp. limoneus]
MKQAVGRASSKVCGERRVFRCGRIGWIRTREAATHRLAGPGRVSAPVPRGPVRGLQIEYSLLSRGPEESIIPTLRELGIGLTVYGVLSRGLPPFRAAMEPPPTAVWESPPRTER